MSFSLVEITLVVALLLSSAALFVAIMALKRSQQHARSSKESMVQMSRELAILNTGAVGMGQRLVAMEKRWQEQHARPTVAAPAVAAHADDDDFRTYSEAVRLFRSGLDSEEVARRCGLSRAETSLIEAMQEAGNSIARR